MWPGSGPSGVPKIRLRTRATTVPASELFVYPGTEHYFAEHDEHAATLLRQRVLAFLGSE